MGLGGRPRDGDPVYRLIYCPEPEAFGAGADRAVAKANELREAMTGAVAGAIPSQFQPYLGRYDATHKRAVHTVIVQGGRLAIDLPGQRVYELLDPDESARRQFAMTDQIAVSFVHDDDGDVIWMAPQ